MGRVRNLCYSRSWCGDGDGDGEGDDSGIDDGLGDMGDFGTVAEADIAAAIGDINANDNDPDNDGGWFSSTVDAAKDKLSNPLGMLAAVHPIGLPAALAQEHDLFADKDADGLIDSGMLEGAEVDHSEPGIADSSDGDIPENERETTPATKTETPKAPIRRPETPVKKDTTPTDVFNPTDSTPSSFESEAGALSYVTANINPYYEERFHTLVAS